MYFYDKWMLKCKRGFNFKKKIKQSTIFNRKKNPLIMPPDYEKLPEPGSVFVEDEEDKRTKNNNIELEKIFSSNSENKNNDEENKISNELEKKILEELE